MKILLPFKKELNPYLDEIIRYSANEFQYGSYNDYDSSFDIVNIHWPEALFQWLEPTEDELGELEEKIIEWKKHSLLVYTKHDFERNKGTTTLFSRLFDLIEKHSHVFVHLGKYSHDIYKQRYPEAKHEIVQHPLYRNSFRVIEKAEARRKLDIGEDALVVIVPGTIRSYRERDIILKGFKSLPNQDKVLICTNQHSEIRYDFPGRIRLKRYFDVKKMLINRFRSKYKSPRYIFTYGKVSNEELELKMSASDLVLIPRINNLNSGLLFLGLTYRKQIVGPACGNIKEQLLDTGYPIFDPGSSSSVRKAIKKGMEMVKAGYQPTEEVLEKYEPEKVALEMDKVFKEAGIQ